MATATLIVYEGAMIHHRSGSGMLGIGTGNFASEKYSDKLGRETRGATAGLWLVVRDRPDTNALQRVHAGQKIDYQQFQIRVLAVGSDRRGSYIKLDIDNSG